MENPKAEVDGSHLGSVVNADGSVTCSFGARVTAPTVDEAYDRAATLATKMSGWLRDSIETEIERKQREARERTWWRGNSENDE